MRKSPRNQSENAAGLYLKLVGNLIIFKSNPLVRHSVIDEAREDPGMYYYYAVGNGQICPVERLCRPCTQEVLNKRLSTGIVGMHPPGGHNTVNRDTGYLSGSSQVLRILYFLVADKEMEYLRERNV